MPALREVRPSLTLVAVHLVPWKLSGDRCKGQPSPALGGFKWCAQ
jgi:hypothetical protein